MKICILSMQKVRNIGSALQAYALRTMLSELGHDVRFIDIERREEDHRLLNGAGISFDYETRHARTFWAKLKKIDRQLLQRIRAKFVWEKQGKILDKFRRQQLGICPGLNEQTYDACVIGSDEVFNCLSSGKWGFTSQLFGEVRQAKKVITYAASCGSTNISGVPQPVQNRIKEAFERISYFSVRDENTRLFTETLSDKEIAFHLDPVLVNDFLKEVENLDRIVKEDYCIVYSYFNRFCDETEINKIKQFCKAHNLKIIGVGAPQLWIKDNLALTPFEMIKLFCDAKFVITDTFHGTILAAKYCGSFATILRESNSLKLGDLLERLGMKKHEIKSMDELEIAMQQENSKNIVQEIVVAQREKTVAYLQEALKEREV